MKIKCELCGKRFDAEKHSGKCPKCGQKNYVMNESKQISPHYTVNVDKTSHSKISEVKRKKKESSGKGRFRTFITILEIFIIAGLIAHIVLEKEENVDVTPQIEESYEEEYCLRDENGFFRFDALGYDTGIIELEKYYGEDVISFDAPEGYEMISYVYDMDVPSGDYDYYGMWQVTQLYMVTTEGISVEPMNSLDAKLMITKDSKGITDMIVHQIFEKQGILTFLVKEGTADYLIVDTYEGEYSNRTFVKRFIMMD